LRNRGANVGVEGVSGTWRDLTDSVNFMASNLTNQVRGIAKVVTAVAQGDLKRKLLVEAKGEIAELADTINNMIDTLATDVATAVVYTGKVLSAAEESRLNQLARSIVLKDVRSPERLLDQATLRLHTHVADLSDHQLDLLKGLHSDQGLLAGRNVLLVDDDMRNVFAMTSVLERYGMKTSRLC
jgi:HAMP domain-containing protein